MRVPAQMGVVALPESVDSASYLLLSRHQAPQIEKDSRANQRTADYNKSDKRERMDSEERAQLNQQPGANQKARPLNSGFNEWLLHRYLLSFQNAASLSEPTS